MMFAVGQLVTTSNYVQKIYVWKNAGAGVRRQLACFDCPVIAIVIDQSNANDVLVIIEGVVGYVYAAWLKSLS